MIFGELDHRLSVVKRWGVVQTIRTQSVAEHSYNVAIIAERIAHRLIPNGFIPEKQERVFYDVVAYALHHDRPESVTGDFPSYMKVFVDEIGALVAVDAYDNDDDIPNGMAALPFVKFVVKCADYVDACVFLRMEISLGNRSVAHHLTRLESRFRRFIAENTVKDLPAKYAALVYDWYKQDVVDKMFGGNGQYVSEIDGFPKTP